MLSEAEIERRLPVWHALSDLFLDTELQPSDHKWIASVLDSSGFSKAELRAILEEEVAPAFGVNLLSVAGEWTSWSEEEVRVIVLRSLNRHFPLGRWIGKPLTRRMVDENYRKIEALLAK